MIPPQLQVGRYASTVDVSVVGNDAGILTVSLFEPRSLARGASKVRIPIVFQTGFASEEAALEWIEEQASALGRKLDRDVEAAVRKAGGMT